MRVFLSGGGHRGSLGAIGAIGYLLWSDINEVVTRLPGGSRSDRWSNVDEVVSVSGGSMLNAALAASPGSDAEETSRLVREFHARFLNDRMLPWKTIPRCAATLATIMLIAAASIAVGAAFGLWGPPWASRAPAAPLVGLFVLPVAIIVGRRLVTSYVIDSAKVITAGRHAKLAPAGTGTRRHVISASGLASGVPYYFVSGGAPLEVAWGAVLTDGYSVTDAAVASCSLPGLGLVRAPAAFRREYLIDGGVSGVFGGQIDDTVERRPEDTWRSGTDMFAIDAARHLVSDSRLARFAREVSVSALLARWLKVSLEATYVNDLLDLEPGQVVRLCVPSIPGSDLGEHVARLDELKEAVGKLGLTSLNSTAMSAAIVVGLVSSMHIRIGLDAQRIDEALRWFGHELGIADELFDVWHSSTA